MTNTLIKWARRIRTRTPSLFPRGANKVDATSLSLTPGHKERGGGGRSSFFKARNRVFCILPEKMSSIIPLPFKCFPVPRIACE